MVDVERMRQIGRKWGLNNKGRKQTEEQRKAHSERAKVFWQGAEQRKVQSERIKALWQSVEHRNKSKLAHLGYQLTEETKRNLSLIRKGKTYEQIYGIGEALIQKQKRSLKMKGRKLLCKHGDPIQKCSPYITGEKHGNFGLKRSDEVKKKCKDNAIKRWQKPELMKKLLDALSKNRASQLGRKRSEETLLKASRSHKLNWQNPEFASRMFKAFDKRPNKPELKLLEILNKSYPNEFKYTGDGTFWISYKGKNLNPDYINCNGKKLIIELFGTYWHKGDDGNFRIEAFKSFGYDTLIVWENELEDKSQLLQKLNDFYGLSNCNEFGCLDKDEDDGSG